MSQLQFTSIIRERGQLTIPEYIRKTYQWTHPLSVVSISVEKPERIVIKPHGVYKKLDWNAIWNSIRLARSFKGENETKSSLEFISEDRENR